MKIFYILSGLLFIAVSYGDGFCGGNNDKNFLFPAVESRGFLIKQPAKVNSGNCAESKV